MKPKLQIKTNSPCNCDEAENGHEHCPKCDCVLTYLEGNVCQSCEEISE